jgi:hypothetical protein
MTPPGEFPDKSQVLSQVKNPDFVANSDVFASGKQVIFY